MSKTRLDSKVKVLVFAGLYHIECDDFVSAQLVLNLAERALEEAGLENKSFYLQKAKKRALYLILSRLKAYGKSCKDFCNMFLTPDHEPTAL